jgi:hypothetical protein
MSALQAVRVGDHGKHVLLLEGRDGAGNESTGSHLASDGEENYLVASGGYRWGLAIGTCGDGEIARRQDG